MILKLEEKYFLDLLYNHQMCTLAITEKGKVCTLTFCPLPQHARWAAEGHGPAHWEMSVLTTFSGLQEGNMSANSACNFAAADQRQMGLLGKHCWFESDQFSGAKHCTKSGNISSATCVSAWLMPLQEGNCRDTFSERRPVPRLSGISGSWVQIL